MSEAYIKFLTRKAISDPMTGLTNVPELPACLFPHQRDIVAWALRRGRAALFAGTGLGKSLMELAWAQAVHSETGKDILHLAPLAVSSQMAREADKFGITARVVSAQVDCMPGTNITNYQKLDHFDLSRFGGVILDESSILKSTDGHYRTKLIEACQSIPFRLAATATPAPNDFMELGNHAEFLGIMKYTDMLATFFAHDGGDTQKWRLKGHAENEFWKWMASWAVMLRKPSDLGYPNDGYDLPPLKFVQHQVGVDYAPNMETGMLFPMQAETLQERIAARRATVADRCNLAVKVVIDGICDNLNSCKHQNSASNTCELTTSQTKINTPERRPRKNLGTTPESKSDAALTPNTLNISERAPVSDALNSADGENCEKALESAKKNTTPYSQPRAAAVPSVKQLAPEKMDAPDLASTIATRLDKFEDCCAVPATGQSDNWKIAQTGFAKLSNISNPPQLDPWVIWCHLNSEQDYLARQLGVLAISIHGGHNDEQKQRLHQDWLDGKAPVLICKPSMFGHGLNWQHCHQCIFVGLNDSFEQFYQAVRRFWRFGQSQPVTAHIIASELEGATVSNIRRKEADAERMAAAMVLHMADLSSKAVRGSVRDTPNYNPTIPVQLPAFLECAA